VNCCKKPFDHNLIARLHEACDVMILVGVPLHHGEDPSFSNHSFATQGCSITEESDDGIVTEIFQDFVQSTSAPCFKKLVDEAAERTGFDSTLIRH
jgi:hypothetical protein